VQVTARIGTSAPPDAERTLLARARDGDGEAFMALLGPHDRALRGLAYRLLGDADAMDDVLQTAYANAFRALPRFGGRASVSTWLYRIVTNACLDELRRGRAAHEELRETARGGASDTAEDVAGRLDLQAALAGLPADERAAVLLVDGEGLSYAEAASALGVREGTVASRLHRARGALRAALGHTGMEVTT